MQLLVSRKNIIAFISSSSFCVIVLFCYPLFVFFCSFDSFGMFCCSTYGVWAGNGESVIAVWSISCVAFVCVSTTDH